MTTFDAPARAELRVRYVEMLLRVAEAGPDDELFDRIEQLLDFGAPPRVEDEQPADLPPDVPVDDSATPAPADSSADKPPRTDRLKGRSAVACVGSAGHHRWSAPDADGWYRCVRGCGAGRAPIQGVEGQRVRPSSEVPPLGLPPESDAAESYTDSEHTEPDAAATEADRPPAARATSEAGREEPAARAADLDESTWGDFGERAASTDDRAPGEDANEPDAELEDDEEGVVRPRAGARTLDSADLARLAGRDDTPANLVRRAPCPRCTTGQLVRDPAETDDPAAFACIACGYRPTLTAAEAAALEHQYAGKQRRRAPSFAGMQL